MCLRRLLELNQVRDQTSAATIFYATFLPVRLSDIFAQRRAAFVKDYQMPAREQGLADHISV
jgi:hypothetical protein